MNIEYVFLNVFQMHAWDVRLKTNKKTVLVSQL